MAPAGAGDADLRVMDGVDVILRSFGDWGNAFAANTVHPARFGYCPAAERTTAVLSKGVVVPCCLDYEGRIALGVSGIASALGFDDLAVTGPNDLLVARLKFAVALATAPATAWLAATASLIRGQERWGLTFGVAFAFVSLAVAAGMAAKVGYMLWAVRAMNESMGFQQPMVLLGEVAPGSWGLAAGLLAAVVVVSVAALRPARAT